MGSPDTQLAKLTRTFSAFTSQIFRCPGLDTPPADADRIGGQDFAFWLIFLSLIAAWFLFLFAPQRERLKLLESRQQVLTAHLALEKREHVRLQRSTQELMKNDPLAWERAARGRLGWVAPGEVVDVRNWRAARVTVQNRQRGPQAPEFSLLGNVPQAPQIPQLPRLPAGFRPTGSTVSYRELLAPQVGTPPIPTVPARMQRNDSARVTTVPSIPPASRAVPRSRP